MRRALKASSTGLPCSSAMPEKPVSPETMAGSVTWFTPGPGKPGNRRVARYHGDREPVLDHGGGDAAGARQMADAEQVLDVEEHLWPAARRGCHVPPGERGRPVGRCWRDGRNGAHPRLRGLAQTAAQARIADGASWKRGGKRLRVLRRNQQTVLVVGDQFRHAGNIGGDTAGSGWRPRPARSATRRGRHRP